MLSVILLILKIIGIAILVILGLLLLIILLVLFVPIRYKVKIEHGDAFFVEGGVSWLLHLIHARIHQSDEKRRIWIRIFGILVYDSLRSPKVKKKKGVKVKDAISHKEKKRDVSMTEADDISKKDEGLNIKESDDISKEDRDLIIKECGDISKEDRGLNIKESDDISKEDRDINIEDADNVSEDKGLSIEKADNILKEDNVSNIKESRLTLKDIERQDREIHKERRTSKSHTYKEKTKTRINVKSRYDKIKEKIIGFFQRLKNKIKNIVKSFLNIRHKLILIHSFLKDQINKEGFKAVFTSVLELLKHIKPRKLKSKLLFGTGDPCSTGQALGMLGILYGFYGDNLEITPDFNNKVFKGSHYALGRIRISTILIIVVKLLLDKRFKELRMNYQLLKEAL